MSGLDSDFSLDGGSGLDVGAGSIIFTPPTDDVVGPVNPDSTGPSARLMGYYPTHARGRNIWVLPDGTYTDVQPGQLATPQDAADGVLPMGDLLAPTYLRVYYGGHEYEVSAQEAAALRAAGYGGNLH